MGCHCPALLNHGMAIPSSRVVQLFRLAPPLSTTPSQQTTASATFYSFAYPHAIVIMAQSPIDDSPDKRPPADHHDSNADNHTDDDEPRVIQVAAKAKKPGRKSPFTDKQDAVIDASVLAWKKMLREVGVTKRATNQEINDWKAEEIKRIVQHPEFQNLGDSKTPRQWSKVCVGLSCSRVSCA